MRKQVDAFAGRIFSIAKHITQNDNAAERVLIETFLQAEHSWLQLLTAAVRLALELPETCSPKPPANILEQGMRLLDPMGRAVFVLRDLEGISADQTGAIVNRAPATVDVCLLRVRLELREVVAQALPAAPMNQPQLCS